MPNMTSYHLEPRLSASHPAPQRKRCCIVCRAGGAGQERVFACDLPVARDEPVYACLLPEPATSRPVPAWQFWRRAGAAKPAPLLTRSAENELRDVRLSQARWEERQARLAAVAEAFRTAALATQCSDFETAGKLRALAAQWTLQEQPSTAELSGTVEALANGSRQKVPQLSLAQREVLVEIKQLPGGMREVWALVDVAAPAELVWRTLTDYERLADIVPSLDENRVLERWAGGVRLQQVAAQELAWGLKFSATATLDIEELPNGITQAGRKGQPGGGQRRIVPRSPGVAPQSVRDICFSLVDSRDLKRFVGTWRIETRDDVRSRLIYVVEVQPQPWLPVGLIAERMAADLRGNLGAVRDHAEELSCGAVALVLPSSKAPASLWPRR